MDVFDKEKDKLLNELREIGADVEIDEKRKRLVVNDEYEICYTNFFYFKKGNSKSISRGERDFVKFIKDRISE